MTTTIAQKNQQQYRKALVKSYYRVSGLEKLEAQIAQDTALGAEERDELTKLVKRRIDKVVESRLACVE